MSSDLPLAFCWTRFGTEAGQSINEITRRKEEERRANSGLFLWGIGNALGPSIRSLVAVESDPVVLFSPTKSPARSVDATPSAVVAWTRAETLDGSEFPLPRASLITSHSDPKSPKTVHYALVCYSATPVNFQLRGVPISMASLRNLQTGNPVGASQVTAIVTAVESNVCGGSVYDIAFQSALVAPYFLRLSNPVPLSAASGGWQSRVDAEWTRRRCTEPS